MIQCRRQKHTATYPHTHRTPPITIANVKQYCMQYQERHKYTCSNDTLGSDWIYLFTNLYCCEHNFTCTYKSYKYNVHKILQCRLPIGIRITVKRMLSISGTLETYSLLTYEDTITIISSHTNWNESLSITKWLINIETAMWYVEKVHFFMCFVRVRVS